MIEKEREEGREREERKGYWQERENLKYKEKDKESK
jgi:hypothetical protein